MSKRARTITVSVLAAVLGLTGSVVAFGAPLHGGAAPSATRHLTVSKRAAATRKTCGRRVHRSRARSACRGRTAAKRVSNTVLQATPPSNTVRPTLNGGPGFPNLSAGVNATHGSWNGSPTGYSYQWQWCTPTLSRCTSISGATASGYTVASPVVAGETVRVYVRARNAAGWSAAAFSVARLVSALPFNFPGAEPTVSGTATQGSTLQLSSHGTWANAPSAYLVQWLDCDTSGNGCTSIAGATAGSYALSAADVGYTVRARVTASNAAGAGAPASSSPTAAVAAIVSSGKSTSSTTTTTSTTSIPATTTTTTTTTSSSPTSTTTTTTTPTTTTSTTSTPTTTSSSTTTTSTTTAPTAPAHTETWAYDDCGNGGVGASAGLVRQWLSFAETNCGPGGDGKGLSDCHAGGVSYCKVMQYLDTNILYYGTGNASPQWSSWNGTAQESWYLHQPSSTSRLTTSAFGGGYFDDQANPAVQAYYQSYVRANYPSEDGLFMDDQSPGVSQQFYGASASSSNELTTDAQIQAAHAAMSAALTKPSGAAYAQMDNTIPNGGNPWQSSQGLTMLTGPVGGLLSEGNPMDNGTLDPFYPGLLDDMAYVNARTSGYVVLMSYGAAGASYQQRSRRVQEATDLLAYEPGRVVSWAELEQGSTSLAVWPESGIYPGQPVQSMGAPGGSGCLSGNGAYCSTGGHNDVQVANGVYRREFGSCSNQGGQFGPCAVIVNTTSSPVTVQPSWLTQSYGHEITFNGGDVQSGGTISLTGASFTAGATTVPAGDAALLAP